MQDDEMPDRCTATARTTGERCKNPPIKGATVCRMHGGSAGQVKRKAQERLDEMADSITADVQSRVEDLVEVYDEADPDDKPAVLREIRQVWRIALDRTGHGPSQTQQLEGDLSLDDLTISFDDE